MSEFGDISSGAADALSEVTPDYQGQPVEQAPQPAPTTEPQTPVAQPAPQADAWDNLPAPDLSSLDPAARAQAEAAIREYQSMATPKLQEAARLRQLSEQYGGADKVQQIAEFYQRLDTDQEFARTVYNQLGTALGVDGQPVTPAPTPEVQPAEVTPGVDLDDLPPDVANAFRTMQEIANRAEQREAESLQRQQEAETIAQYQEAENKIMQQHPDYTEADMRAVYGLAYSTSGDLYAANQLYQQTAQHIIGRYIGTKENVPPQVPGGYTRGEVPTTVENVQQARAAATEAIMRDFG